MDAMDMPPLLTAKEAAEVLRCTERMVTRMCRQGKLKAVKIGREWRLNRDALLEFAGVKGIHVDR